MVLQATDIDHSGATALIAGLTAFKTIVQSKEDIVRGTDMLGFAFFDY